MRKGVVTVVLPIYKVENYLERCMESVVNQTYRNLEIILVDDGSPDRCPQLCEEWAKKDARIKVVHKENGGLGYARNTGIENATGEYIYFLDSDDYIELDTIEKVYTLAKKENAEIVTFGFKNVNAKCEVVREVIPTPKQYVYDGEDVQNVFLPSLLGPNLKTGEISNITLSIWGSFYSMELIERTNWRVVSEREIISEDIYSLLYLYKNVRKVAILPEALYFYCENMGSLTRTFKKDRFERIKYFYDACIKVCDELQYSDEVKERMSYPYFSNTIAALKLIVNSDMSNQEQKKMMREIIGDTHLQKVLHKTGIERETFARKLLLKAMRAKSYTLCYWMVKVKA